MRQILSDWRAAEGTGTAGVGVKSVDIGRKAEREARSLGRS